jgi:hypothetical protein
MSDDLSSFFNIISEGKKKQEEEFNSLLGDDFFGENFLENLLESAKPKKEKKESPDTSDEDEDEDEEDSGDEIEESAELSYVDQYLQFIKKTEKPREVSESLENPSSREIQELKNLVWQLMRDVHAHGGGGEVNLAYMDLPLTSVTSSSYSATTNDYYIGVNYAGAVSITLPKADREGKVFIVKDELGEASKGTNRYITILPTGSDLIDGRDRAILAYDYGSLTFIWKNNSWRVV